LRAAWPSRVSLLRLEFRGLAGIDTTHRTSPKKASGDIALSAGSGLSRSGDAWQLHDNNHGRIKVQFTHSPALRHCGISATQGAPLQLSSRRGLESSRKLYRPVTLTKRGASRAHLPINNHGAQLRRGTRRAMGTMPSGFTALAIRNPPRQRGSGYHVLGRCDRSPDLLHKRTRLIAGFRAPVCRGFRLMASARKIVLPRVFGAQDFVRSLRNPSRSTRKCAIGATG
jgi:hypothetical protein